MKKEMEKDKRSPPKIIIIQTHRFHLSFPESFEISVKRSWLEWCDSPDFDLRGL